MSNNRTQTVWCVHRGVGTEVCTAKRLFDHLVGGGEQRCRNGEAECLSGLEIDGQVELGRLPDRKVRRIGTLEDAIP